MSAPIEVLILQHPLEVGHPKGSAQLLHLSLQGSRLINGERFDASRLQTLLHAPWIDATTVPGQAVRIHPVLLYPAGSSMVPDNTSPDGADSCNATPASGTMRLVVLDGTWRKSRKMLALNPLLQALPRLALDKPAPSRYARLRKAHLPDQLSTLEATCHALMRLGCQGDGHEALLHAFSGFIEEQEGYMRGRLTGMDLQGRPTGAG